MKITNFQYIDFCKSFGRNNRNKEDLRFGQKFCNDFDVQDVELFYCEDRNHAKLLALKYVE